MDRAQKAAAVAELNRTFSEVGVVVVTRNLGLSVAQSTQLRNRMREAGATYKVSKNRLARIALDGTDYLSLGDMLTGPVGLATSSDPVAAARVAVDSAPPDREAAENDLTRLLRELPLPAEDPDVTALDAASRRVALARQVHTDLVRDALAVRTQRVVRLLRLARRHPRPSYFDIDDPGPVAPATPLPTP